MSHSISPEVITETGRRATVSGHYRGITYQLRTESLLDTLLAIKGIKIALAEVLVLSRVGGLQLQDP